MRAQSPGGYALLQVVGALIVLALIVGSFWAFGWFVETVWCPIVNC
jgi:hypothetical protein